MDYAEFLEYCIENGYEGDVESLREAYDEILDEAHGAKGQTTMNLLRNSGDSAKATYDILRSKGKIGNFAADKTQKYYSKALADKSGKRLQKLGKAMDNVQRQSAKSANKIIKKYGSEPGSVGSLINKDAAKYSGQKKIYSDPVKEKHRQMKNGYRLASSYAESTTYDNILEFFVENGVYLDEEQLNNLKDRCE